MPQLGETVAEGKVINWFKKVGDKVAPGENLFEIETDKVTVEVPAISAGVLSAINVGEGQRRAGRRRGRRDLRRRAAAGEARRGVRRRAAAAGRTAADAAARPHAANGSPRLAAPRRDSRPVPRGADAGAAISAQRAANGVLVTPARPPPRGRGRHSTSPAITGTGPHGRITGTDIETAIAPGPRQRHRFPRGRDLRRDDRRHPPRPAARRRSVSTMRRTIAKRLVESKSSIPHFYLTAHVGIDRLMALRDEINAGAPKDLPTATPAYKLSVNDFMIKALALALKAVPAANAMWSQDGILEFEHADVAVAVSVPNGLITPVIHAAEAKPLSRHLERDEGACRPRARRARSSPSEYKGGTTSISNLGMYGVLEFSAIINPPQATILAVGAAQRAPSRRQTAASPSSAASPRRSPAITASSTASLGAELLAPSRRISRTRWRCWCRRGGQLDHLLREFREAFDPGWGSSVGVSISWRGRQ